MQSFTTPLQEMPSRRYKQTELLRPWFLKGTVLEGVVTAVPCLLGGAAALL
jgi:hypothetical protein